MTLGVGHVVTPGGHNGPFQVTKDFCVLFVAVSMWLYMPFETHTSTLRGVKLTACKIHFHTPVSKERKGPVFS